MPKKKGNQKPTTEKPVNAQQKLSNQQSTNRILESGISQPHNAKKEALGPNTDR